MRPKGDVEARIWRYDFGMQGPHTGSDLGPTRDRSGDPLSRPRDGHATALLGAEPALGRLVELARSRLRATQVWLFGSRARGDARSDSDWDFFLVLPNDAPEADLDPAGCWRIGRDAGLTANVFAEREDDVRAASGTVNTLAFVLQTEGVRIG